MEIKINLSSLNLNVSFFFHLLFHSFTEFIPVILKSLSFDSFIRFLKFKNGETEDKTKAFNDFFLFYNFISVFF
jgi:hypothetical protein